MAPIGVADVGIAGLGCERRATEYRVGIVEAGYYFVRVDQFGAVEGW